MDPLDPALLRTFLAFVDSGTLARASAIVGRTPSAVTAQMQRLEAAVGEPLFQPQGRGRALTAAGQELAGHARHILAAHRAALLGLKGIRAEGALSVATTQDFADHGMARLLRLFARTHPRVRLNLRVGRSAELARAFEEGGIDVLVAMRAAPLPDEAAVLHEPMVWLAAADGPAAGGPASDGDELPLALLDPPCGFRDAALSALDRAGRRYRIAAASQSLSGLRAAVAAGIAVTLRTARWQGDGLAPTAGLPAVPDAVFAVRVRPDAPPMAGDFADLLAEGLPADASTAEG